MLVLPSLLATSLMFDAGAYAQNVTVTGDIGRMAGGCNAITPVPHSCVGQTMVALPGGSVNAPTWTLLGGSRFGVAIGTNLSDNNSGLPPASGSVSITNGGVAKTDYVYFGFENGTSGSAVVSGAGSQWLASSAAVIGHYGHGDLQILGGGLFSTINPDYFYVGYGATGDGAVTVSGVDAATGIRSSLLTKNRIYIGNDGNGILNILDGGLASSEYTMFVGEGAASNSLVNVNGVNATGDRSTLRIVNNQFWVGDYGQGTLNVLDGGLVNVKSQIGFGADVTGQGTGTVSGVNLASGLRSTIASDSVSVGKGHLGQLDILDGGLVSATSFITIASAVGAVGTMTVDGVAAGTNIHSTATTDGSFYVGEIGTGTLNISNGGLVHAGVNTYMTNSSTASGAMHLIGGASGLGVLETGAVIKGAGAAAVDIDGGMLRALRTESNFMNVNAVTVGAQGAWIDNNGYDIGISSAFSGTSTFNKVGLGTLLLSGDSSAFTGSTTIQAGALQIDGTLGGPTEVMAGTLLFGTGQVGATVNRGMVTPGHSGAFGTLTINGDYTAAGGSLQISSQIGDDSSPTSRLVINGGTAGVTPVSVFNVDGLGAKTQQGIQVIRVSGASNGQFNMVNGDYSFHGQPALVAGAFGYFLQKDQANGSWYLRSTLLNSMLVSVSNAASGPVPDPEPLPEPAPGAGAGAGSAPAPAPEGAVPFYQAGVPVYEAYANMILSLSGVSTLHQRVGNRSYDAADHDRNGVWVRVQGASSHLEPSRSSSSTNQSIDSWQAQFGVDRILSGEKDGARVVGGVSARYGTANTKVYSFYGDGDIDTKSYGVGGSLTWYSEQGSYIDAQAQATLFRSDLSSRVVGGLAQSQLGRGYALSLEGGRPFPVGGGFSIIPQAQLSFVTTSFGFTDKFDAKIDSDRSDSLQGRLGLAFDYRHNWGGAAGRARRLDFYGVVNLKQEFLEPSRVMVSSTPLDSRMRQTWGGLGLGWKYGWGESSAIYGEVNADSDLHSSYNVSATAGLRIMF